MRNATGKTPTSLGDSSNQQNDTDNVKKIISEYKNRPSLIKIKETLVYQKQTLKTYTR